MAGSDQIDIDFSSQVEIGDKIKFSLVPADIMFLHRFIKNVFGADADRCDRDYDLRCTQQMYK